MDQQLRTLHPPRDYRFDDEFFFALCQANETLRLERDANRPGGAAGIYLPREWLDRDQTG